MTSLTYSTHIFVFVFLNVMDLSEEACHDYLDAETWGGNLTDTFSLMTTKDPKDTLNCTLETECGKGRHAACDLLTDCFLRFDTKTQSPECKGESSQEIHFFHFMCLMAKAFNHSSKACEYDTVCSIMCSETASTQFDLTTTPTPTPTPTTTTLPETTTSTTSLPSPTTAAIATLVPTTTTLPETTTTVLPSPPTTTTTAAIATLEPTATSLAETTTTVLPSPPTTTTTAAIATLVPTTTTLPETTTTVLPSPPTTTTTAAIATLEPTATSLAETTTTVLPSPPTTTAATATLEPTATSLAETTTTVLPSPPTTTAATATLEPTATSLAEGQSEAKRNGDEQSDLPKDTTDNLQYALVLSLLLNAILPAFVYLYMRRRWLQDRRQRTSTHNGNAGDQPKTESGAPTHRDVDTELLLQTMQTHSDHSVGMSVNAGEQTEL